jgi:ketosteroid isomerase-like protein
MSAHQATVHEYMEGFKEGDHERILRCLTDDVLWIIHGHRTTTGKVEFDSEIVGADFEGKPILSVDRVFEDGDVVIVTGEGTGNHREAGPFRFAYNDLFTFRGDLIERVDSYVVPLP